MSEANLYVAAKRVKVQTADGRVEVRSPGDPVPEAATWPKLSTWMASGHIARTDGRVITKREENVIGATRTHAPARNVSSETTLTVIADDRPLIGSSEYIKVKQELEGLNKEQIVNLARDFELKIHKDQKKEVFVEAILKHVIQPAE